MCILVDDSMIFALYIDMSTSSASQVFLLPVSVMLNQLLVLLILVQLSALIKICLCQPLCTA
jgi:hypothetical protein